MSESAPGGLRSGEGRLALVTGATGFVGLHLVGGLLLRDWRIRVLVRPTSDRRVIARGVEIVEGDVNEPATLPQAMAGVDVVFHLACAVAGTFKASADAYRLFHHVNVQGTANVARAALAAGSPTFVHLSSTAAMGASPEPRADENSPCCPTAPYQRSKREAELSLLALHRTDGLKVRIVRSCLVLGEGKRSSEVLQMFRLVRHGIFPLIGDAKRLRKPLIMVDDLVSALLLAADRGTDGGIYLVTAGVPFLLGDILDSAKRQVGGAHRVSVRVPVGVARLAAAASQLAARVLPIDPPITNARIDLLTADREIDIGRARRELGFAPRFQDLDEMLGRTYHFFRREGLL